MELRTANASGEGSARGPVSPLSQDVLNSVRMVTEELRITMGSEPRKFIEVAEYKSFSAGKKNKKKNMAAGK